MNYCYSNYEIPDKNSSINYNLTLLIPKFALKLYNDDKGKFFEVNQFVNSS